MKSNFPFLPTQFKGILFDFDGVLACTMEDNFRAWHRTFFDFGAEITEKQFYPLEGMRLEEIAAALCSMHGVFADMQEIFRKKEAYYKEDHSFSLYPGVEEFLERLTNASISMGMVTGARRERLEHTFPSPLLTKFSVIVTGETGGRGKSYPDPYIAGARGIGILPQECIVVENAPLGITSAKAAGAYCIAITSTVFKEVLKEADEVIESFSDLQHTIPIQQLLNQ